VAQLICLSPDNLGSKNNCLPRATFSGVVGLSFGAGTVLGSEAIGFADVGWASASLVQRPDETTRVRQTPQTHADLAFDLSIRMVTPTTLVLRLTKEYYIDCQYRETRSWPSF
jgi:hypothetical protein